MDDTQARRVAYRIAAALQSKFKDKIICVRIECMPLTKRLVVEYVLTEGGIIESCMAYSQTFFEDESKEHLTWLATTLYISLKQQFEWNLRGGRNAYTSHAGKSNETERPRKPTVPTSGVVQNRRDKSISSQRRIGKSNSETDPKPAYIEDVPAGLV